MAKKYKKVGQVDIYEPEKKKNNNGWVWVVVIIIGLILISECTG